MFDFLVFESPWKYFIVAERIIIIKTRWTISVSTRMYSYVRAWEVHEHKLPALPPLYSCLLLMKLKSYKVNSGSLLLTRQARTLSIPVSLERTADNQKLWLFCWKATAWWKDVPIENNSDRSFLTKSNRKPKVRPSCYSYTTPYASLGIYVLIKKYPLLFLPCDCIL